MMDDILTNDWVRAAGHPGIGKVLGFGTIRGTNIIAYVVTFDFEDSVKEAYRPQVLWLYGARDAAKLFTRNELTLLAQGDRPDPADDDAFIGTDGEKYHTGKFDGKPMKPLDSNGVTA